MPMRIFDPSIPYVGRITPKSLIRIEGPTPRTAYKFTIRLQSGPSPASQDDTALQISLQVPEGTVALNSLQNGIWGDEQVHSISSIKQSERFVIVILCETNCLKVEINGRHNCNFPHRIPCITFSHLAIDGDVSVTQISYEKTSVGSAPGVSSSRPIPHSDNEFHHYGFNDGIRSQSGHQSRQTAFHPLSPEIHPPSNGGGFDNPPSYAEAVYRKQFQPFPDSENNHPSEPSAVVSPVDNVASSSASSGRYLRNTSPVVQSSLNATSSNFRAVTSVRISKRCWYLGIAFIVAIAVCVIIYTTKGFPSANRGPKRGVTLIEWN